MPFTVVNYLVVQTWKMTISEFLIRCKNQVQRTVLKANGLDVNGRLIVYDMRLEADRLEADRPLWTVLKVNGRQNVHFQSK